VFNVRIKIFFAVGKSRSLVSPMKKEYQAVPEPENILNKLVTTLKVSLPSAVLFKGITM